MGDSHTQDRQLVGFPGQGAAGRHHVRQLGDVLGHFVAPTPLNLTVVLSKTEREQLGCAKYRLGTPSQAYLNK